MIAKTKATGTGPLLSEVLAYTSSLQDDKGLVNIDVVGSIAHLAMLEAVALVSPEDAKAIRDELVEILREGWEGRLTLPEDEEDVHMAVEARLTEKLGERAGLLHTARSRNDQIALDLSLYVRDMCRDAVEAVAATVDFLAARAEADHDVILPAYTHRQRAMPVTGGFWWASYGAMFVRDLELLDYVLYRADVLPLGAGAVAGTSLPIDRDHVKKTLDFSRCSINAMDAVGDRDFEIDFAYACARIMSHVGKIASDMIEFASSESRFIVLGDAIACGSSMMPQKKNPDLFELLRGKGARTQGSLTTLMAITSKLPSGYGRDLQEGRQALFEAAGTVLHALPMLRIALQNVAFDRERCLAAVDGDYMQATDLAEAMVLRHKTPFRTAYRLVGELVKLARDANVPLAKVTITQAQSIDFRFDAQVLAALDPRKSPARKTSAGGTAPERVDEQIQTLRNAAKSARNGLKETTPILAMIGRLVNAKNG
ncbi:MAG: argininosuccinate lyase [Polyangiaceae bacterium]